MLAPVLALALAWENLALGVAAVTAAGGAGAAAPQQLQGVLALRGAVQAFVIPLFLVTQFELNYAVHKRRSSNFFGCLFFDQGRRRAAGLLSLLVRHSIWLVALALLLVQVVLNAPYMADPAHAPSTKRFTFKGVGDFVGTVRSSSSSSSSSGGGGGGGGGGSSSSVSGGGADGDGAYAGYGFGPSYAGWQNAVDVVPWLALLGFSLYSGTSLWRYGTTISTDVRATAVNPWAAVLGFM